MKENKEILKALNLFFKYIRSQILLIPVFIRTRFNSSEDKAFLIFIMPALMSVAWIIIASAATHLYIMEFEVDDGNIPLIISLHIFTFTWLFYLFTFVAVLLARVPLFSRFLTVRNLRRVMAIDILFLVLLTIFPGESSGGLISFTNKDIVLLPSLYVQAILCETGIVREGEIPDNRTMDELIRALGNKDPEVRRKAAWTMGNRKRPAAVKPLISALDDTDVYVVITAVESLGRLNDVSVIPYIVKACEREEDATRICNVVCGELERIDSPLAVDALLTVVNSRGQDYKLNRMASSAAIALGNIGNPKAAESLIMALNNKDMDTNSIIEALGKIGDAKAAYPLLAMLKNSELSSGQEIIIDALSKIKTPAAVEPLINIAIQEGVGYIQKKAIEALGRIGDPRAVDSLIYLASKEPVEKYYDIREEAVKALGAIGDTRAVPLLINILEDKRYMAFHCCAAAALALGNIGGSRAIGSLIAALNNDNEEPSIRENAAHALGVIGDPEALEPLEAALHKEHSNFAGYEMRAAIKKLNAKINKTTQ